MCQEAKEWHESTLVIFLCVGRIAVGLWEFARSFCRKRKARQENCFAPNDPDPLNFVFTFCYSCLWIAPFHSDHLEILWSAHYASIWVEMLNSVCTWQSSWWWCLWMETSHRCLHRVNGRQKAFVATRFFFCQASDRVSQVPILIPSVAALGIILLPGAVLLSMPPTLFSSNLA